MDDLFKLPGETHRLIECVAAHFVSRARGGACLLSYPQPHYNEHRDCNAAIYSSSHADLLIASTLAPNKVWTPGVSKIARGLQMKISSRRRKISRQGPCLSRHLGVSIGGNFSRARVLLKRMSGSSTR